MKHLSKMKINLRKSLIFKNLLEMDSSLLQLYHCISLSYTLSSLHLTEKKNTTLASPGSDP